MASREQKYHHNYISINRKIIRSLLRVWHSSLVMGKNSLAQLTIVEARLATLGYVDSLENRGRILRELVREGIRALGPEEVEPPADEGTAHFAARPWRYYNILTQQYLNHQAPDYVANQLHISLSRYYDEQAKALDALVEFLRQQETTAISARSARAWERSDEMISPGQAGENEAKQISLEKSALAPTVATAPRPPPYFIGRREELERLKVALIDGQATALTALQGMGGVGKTTTALKLAAELAPYFSGGIFWASLPEHDGNPRPILRAWARLCAYDLTAEVALNTMVDLVRGILTARQVELGPLLVIMDDVRVAWLEAAQFLQRTLPIEASFLLTTRDENLAVALGAMIHRLDMLPPDEALVLLKAHAGVAIVEADLEAAKTLLETIGYLPLAIELAGKRLALLGRKPGFRLSVLGDAVAERANTALSGPGQRGLVATFSITYEALFAETQHLFRWLGVFEVGSLVVTDVAGVLGLSEVEIEPGLDQLVLSSFLNWGEIEGTYTLHPLLQQYAQTLLAETGEATTAEQHHLDYYLACVQANGPLDVAGNNRLEAVLPNLRKAVKFAVVTRNYTALKQLGLALCDQGDFLIKRGYAQDAYDLLQQVVDACRTLGDRREEGLYRGHLGRACYHLGQFEPAVDHLQHALTIAQEVDDHANQKTWLEYLGKAFHGLGQVDQAIACFQQALAMAQQRNNLRQQGIHMGNLGRAYLSISQFRQADTYYRQALAIFQTIGDKSEVGKIWGGLGGIYAIMGQAKWAITCLQRALKVAREMGDRRSEARQLGNLGGICYNAGDYEQAIHYELQALAMAQEIGDQRMEGYRLGDIGKAYLAQGQPERARPYFRQALSIARTIRHRHGENIYLHGLGQIHYVLGQVEQAIDYYTEALQITQEIGNQHEERVRWLSLGQAYESLGQAEWATDCYRQALTLSQALENLATDSANLNRLGIAYDKLGQIEQAMACHRRALIIAREVEYPYQEGVSLSNLGKAYHQLGETGQAIDYWQQALRIFEAIQSSDADLVRRWLDEGQADTP